MKKLRMIGAGSAIVVLSMAPIQAASAITDYDTPPPTVEGVDVSRTVREPDARVASAQVTRGQELPVTGGDILGLAGLGAGAVAAGFVLVRRSRTVD